mgnify:FL=1
MATAPRQIQYTGLYNNPGFDRFRETVANKPISDLDPELTISSVFNEADLDSYAKDVYAMTLAKQGNQEAIDLYDERTKNSIISRTASLSRYNRIPKPIEESPNGMFDTAISIAGRGMRLDPDEYSEFDEIQMNEEDYQNFARLNVNPNRSFDADTNAIDAYRNPLSPEKEERLKDSLVDEEGNPAQTYRNPGAAVAGQLLENQFDINENSPWRLKSFFNVSNPNPNEMFNILKNEFPNLKREDIAWLDPRNHSLGVGVYVPKKGAEGEAGELELIPVRPQFGVPQLLNETMQETGNNTVAFALEYGGMKLLAPVLKTALKDAGKQYEQQLTLGGKAKRGATTALLSGTSIGLGRLAQLAYGRAQGVNEVNLERAFDDAGMAALFAGLGTAAVGTSIGIVSSVWGAITGKAVPPNVIAVLHRRVEQAKKGTTKGGEVKSEFTEKELADRVNLAAQRTKAKLADTDLEYQVSAGELTQDEFLQQIEHDLWTQLGNDSSGKQAYDQMLENNDLLLYEFWKDVTESKSGNRAVQFKEFRDYFANKRKEYLDSEKAAIKSLDDISEKDASFDNFFPVGSNEPVDILRDSLPEGSQKVFNEMDTDAAASLAGKYVGDDVGSVFTETSTDGGLVFKNDTPVLLAERDNNYLQLKENFNEAVTEFENVTYDNPGDALNIKLTDPVTKQTKSLSQAFREEFPSADPDSNKLMIGLDNVFASKDLRNMIPMSSEGISVIKQLAGIKTGINKTTGEKEVVPELNLTFGQMVSAIEALEASVKMVDDKSTQAAFLRLKKRFEIQADHLLEENAKRAFRQDKGLAANAEVAGVPFQKWMQETNYAGEISAARAAIVEGREMIERTWLKNLVDRPENEVVDYILSGQSTSTQVQDLIGFFNNGNQAAVRIQNLQKLTLQDIGRKLRGKTLTEQNKAWLEFKEANEEKLRIIFPGDTGFDKFKKFEDFQNQALINISKRADDFKNAEKELGEPVHDFLNSFFNNREGRASGLLEDQLLEIQRLRKQYPAIKPVINDMLRQQLRARFTTGGLNLGGQKGPAGTIFKSSNQGLNVGAFISFVEDNLEPGSGGTNKLGKYLGQMLGKDVGPEYAKDLRMLALMFRRAQKRTDSTALGSSVNKELEEWMSTASTVQKITLGPLNPLSYKITTALYGFRNAAKSSLLEIMLDPRKTKAFVEARQKVLSERELYKFIGGLAASNVYTENMGSEESLSNLEREIGSQLNVREQIQGATPQ